MNVQAGRLGTVRGVDIPSDGLRLSGALHVRGPEDAEPRPGVLVLHGFGGSKDAPTHRLEAELYADCGYVVLRIDFRGCGASEGARGHILCQDAVSDARNALTWFAAQPEVDAGRIIVSGQSYGAAVGLYAAATDRRIAAAVSIGGWGDGLTKFRGQHKGEDAWARFTAMLEDGARRREQGLATTVSRWDVVPIPEHLRSELPPGMIMEFPIEVVESMADFRPVDVVGDIAPRPLLLLHAANDSVTPSEQSVELMRRAGAGAELMLLSGVDHFAFASAQSRIPNLIRQWLDTYVPIKA